MLGCHFPPFSHKSLLVIHVMARSCPSNRTVEMQSPSVKRSTSYLLGITDTIHVLLIVEQSAYLELPCIA